MEELSINFPVVVHLYGWPFLWVQLGMCFVVQEIMRDPYAVAISKTLPYNIIGIIL